MSWVWIRACLVRGRLGLLAVCRISSRLPTWASTWSSAEGVPFELEDVGGRGTVRDDWFCTSAWCGRRLSGVCAEPKIGDQWNQGQGCCQERNHAVHGMAPNQLGQQARLSSGARCCDE